MKTKSILEEKINIKDLLLPSDPLDHDNQKLIKASSSVEIKEEDTIETAFEGDDQNYDDKMDENSRV